MPLPLAPCPVVSGVNVVSVVRAARGLRANQLGRIALLLSIAAGSALVANAQTSSSSPSLATPPAITGSIAHSGSDADLVEATPVATNPLFELMDRQECGWQDLEFANLLKAHPELITSRNSVGESLLHVAARKSYENEIFLLLLAGADVNARDSRGRTPLHLAAGINQEDAWMIRDMLVLKKADINARDKQGWTPLMRAAQSGNTRTIEFLVWMGATIDAEKDSSLPSAHQLARDGGYSEAAAMLAKASDGDVVTLQSASREIPPHIARAFTDAAAKKDYDLLGELMIDGVDIDTQDADKATALHRAVYRAHEDVVTYLLMLGANPNLADKDGNTPYMAASNWFGLSMDWMRAMLLLAGTDADKPVNKYGYTPFGLAVKTGNEESAQLLIWCGIDPTKKIGEKGTPMEIACRIGTQRQIDLLRRNGVTEAEFVDPVPQKRLVQYVKRGKETEVRELIAAGGVSLSELTDEGRTLINEACRWRYPDMIRLLLSLGADPEQRDKNGGTLLYATLSWDTPGLNQFRKELIARKVNLNTPDNDGRTPLMKVASHGVDCAGLRQLVEAGADLGARDKKGRTALDLALQSGRPDATKYLLSVNAPYTDPEKVETGVR